MAYNQRVASFCSDPANSFQVKAELKVRKALECRTDWNFEFTRNEDQYEVDILCYKYLLRGNVFDRVLIGRIEVESTKQWKGGKYPRHWRTFSYLRRKIEKWHKDTPKHLLAQSDIWTGQPWDDAHKTIYLKVSEDLKGCHAALVGDVWNSKKRRLVVDNRPGLNTPDRSHYFRTPFIGCDVTRYGWENVIPFIMTVFENNAA